MRTSFFRSGIFKFFSIIILLVLIAGASGAYYLYANLQPAHKSDKPVTLTIPRGAGTAKIANLLKQKGLVRDANVFKLYVWYKKEGSRFQAGTYEIRPGIKLGGIIDKLNRGETVKEATIRFTVPEGYTIKQIAQMLSDDGFVSLDEFMAKLRTPQLFQAQAVKQIPAQGAYIHPLEGYLFPETYELKKGSTEQQIIERMLDETDKKLATLPAGWESLMQQKGLTLHRLLTIASLIEREVVVDEERPLVASVIYNRLAANKALEIDATVQYVLGKQKERIYYKDLKVKSPYNTYLHKGLPPGPIASPSLKSIEAALHPATTKYMYYVTRKDGTQRHLFAETYAEHKKNIAASKQTAQK